MKTAEPLPRAAAGHRPTDGPHADQPGGGPVGNQIHTLLRDVWALVHDHLLLIALDAQRAGRSVTLMMLAGVITAVLAITAWFALATAVMFWLIADNAAWGWGFLVLAAIHVAACVALLLWIRRLGKEVMFAATLRQLRPSQDGGGALP